MSRAASSIGPGIGSTPNAASQRSDLGMRPSRARILTARIRCLPRFTLGDRLLAQRAGLPATIKSMSCGTPLADNLWRETGNLLLAQPLLRHESVATTQAYLHPSREDLAHALTSLQVVKPEPDA